MSNSLPLVSIIIPSYNSISLIKTCLENILQTDYPNYELLLVDDGSTDGSDAYIDELSHQDNHIKLIRNAKNSGPSFTRNNGIQHARGKYIAFLETDMEVEPDWLQILVDKLEQRSDLGAVQSKVLDLYHREVIVADGVFYDPHTFWVVCPGCGLAKSQSNQEKYVSIGAVGCLIRKEILDTIGGFDEHIVHNIDDIDLGWRIWLTGHKVLYIPQAITYHWTMKPLDLRSQTTPSERSEFYFQKTPRIFLKNYSWLNIIRYMPWLLAILFIRALANVRRGNFKPLKGYFKAVWWNIVMLPQTLAERRVIQKQRKFTDQYLLDTIFLKGSFWKIYTQDIGGVLNRAFQSLGDAQANAYFPETCYICNQPFVLQKSIGPFQEKYSYRICAHCMGAMLYPYPQPAGFQEKYSQEEYYEDLSKPVKNSFLDRMLHLRTYQTQSEYIAEIKSKGTVLDVGCGNGETLQALQHKGWSIYGNDISEIALRKTGERTGQKEHMLLGEFCKTTFPTKFDVISFWHVLEHIDNPREYLIHTFNNLNNGGYITAEVPNFDSMTFALTKQHYAWLMLPEHNLYYSIASIERLLKETGFTNIAIECPMRAILNLSNSLHNILRARKLPSFVEKTLFTLSIPFSLPIMFIFCTLGKGEVIRFKAQKPL